MGVSTASVTGGAGALRAGLVLAELGRRQPLLLELVLLPADRAQLVVLAFQSGLVRADPT